MSRTILNRLFSSITKAPVRSRRRLAVQLLEDRCNPSGNVTVSLINGDLIIKGDDDPAGNQVDVLETGNGVFTLTGQKNTTINHQASIVTNTLGGQVTRDIKGTFFGGPDEFKLAWQPNSVTTVRDINIAMGAGNDLCAIIGPTARNVTISQSAGATDNDTTTIAAGSQFVPGGFSGDVTVNDGGGIDKVDVLVAAAGDVTVANKDGHDVVHIWGRSKIGGSLAVTNTLGLAGNTYTLDDLSAVGKSVKFTSPGDYPTTTTITNAVIGGSLSVAGGSDMVVPTATVISGTFVGQNVSVVGGKGYDRMALSTCAVGNNVSFKGGSGQNLMLLTLNTIVGGSVSMVGGDSVDTFGTGANSGVSVDGDINLKFGDGESLTLLDGIAVHGSVSVQAGLGKHTFVTPDATKIDGSLSIHNGEGDTSTTVDGLVLGGNLTLVNGQGSDQFSGTEAFDVGGDLTIKNGDGGSKTSFASAALADFISGNVMITAGAGKDLIFADLLFVEGSTTIKLGADSDTLEFDDSAFVGNFSVDMGAGDDMVSLDNNPAPPLSIRFLGDFNLTVGKGNDTVLIGDNLPNTQVIVFGAITGDFRMAETLLIDPQSQHVGFPSF